MMVGEGAGHTHREAMVQSSLRDGVRFYLPDPALKRRATVGASRRDLGSFSWGLYGTTEVVPFPSLLVVSEKNVHGVAGGGFPCSYAVRGRCFRIAARFNLSELSLQSAPATRQIAAKPDRTAGGAALCGRGPSFPEAGADRR
jgi:hypothetical protein